MERQRDKWEVRLSLRIVENLEDLRKGIEVHWSSNGALSITPHQGDLINYHNRLVLVILR